MNDSTERAVPVAEILAFLRNPDSYPHQPDSVQIVQTHASYVAIVPPLVYKVKKPVDYGFLDFSTLENRRYYCEEEVRLNSRLSPEVYDGVVPITRDQGALRFGGEGIPVEYAVRMKQLDEAGFLKHLLARGEVGPADIDRIVDRLARFYRDQTPRADIAIWGRTGALRISTDENFEQTEPYVDDLIPRFAFEAIRTYTAGFYEHHALLLNRRRVGGHILDCHGDLHLEHIHITPDDLTIYDCIEFNKRFRYIDVANDVGFLAMDLDDKGHRDLSRYLAERMARRLEDADLLKVLDFYKCYRAYVRAKVESFRCRATEVEEEERKASADRARRYYQLSLQYAVAGSRPLVVILMGRIGTGKSLHAHRVGESLGFEVVSSDRFRKELAGLPLHVRTSESDRERLYAPENTAEVYEVLAGRALQRSEDHLGTVLDATYGSRRLRDELRSLLRAAGIAYCFVELESPEHEIKERLRDRDQADDVVSDARLEDFETISSRFEAPDALEDVYHFTVNTGRHRDLVTAEILRRISRLQSSRRMFGGG